MSLISIRSFLQFGTLMFWIVNGYAHELNFRAWIIAQNIRRLSFLRGDDLKFFAKTSAILDAFRNNLCFHITETWESCSLLLCYHISIHTHWNNSSVRCTCTHGE